MPVWQLGGVEVWNFIHLNVRPQVMILSDINTFVELVHVVKECGFATATTADYYRQSHDGREKEGKRRRGCGGSLRLIRYRTWALHSSLVLRGGIFQATDKKYGARVDQFL